MITKKTDANLLHPSFRLKALATTAQRPVEKDLFPAKIGDDVEYRIYNGYRSRMPDIPV